jgi:hypothetical protein
MIPTLLWQCPLCHVDDALRHRRHWFRPDEVNCRHCRTMWEVQRVIGNDYLLTIVRGETELIGCQRPLAEWYDVMKAGLQLVPHHEPSLSLGSQEALYVKSRQAELLAEEDSPLFSGWDQEEAPCHQEGHLGLSFKRAWDAGILYLTSERLIWTGLRGTLSFWLKRMNSVHTEVTWFLGLLYGLRLYKFRFREESILKWLTYIALAAKRMDEVYRHRISFSNY